MNRLIVFLGMLLLVSAPAWGTGRPCPTDRGACFIDLPQGPGFAIFTEEEFLQFSIDGLHDFVRWNLTEEGFLFPCGSPILIRIYASSGEVT
jgi:hypothetical protein